MNMHLAAFCSRTLFIYNPKHEAAIAYIAIHYNLYNKKTHIHKDEIYRLKLDNLGYPYIWPSHCKDSQITSLKLYLIVTLFVNFKHNFHKENETFKKKKLKQFKEKSLKIEPFLSELPYHIYLVLVLVQ